MDNETAARSPGCGDVCGNSLQATRRQLFQRAGFGIGGLALASLLSQDTPARAARRTDPLTPRKPHFAPRARSVIYIHLVGAPSHLDLFDYKPELQ